MFVIVAYINVGLLTNEKIITILYEEQERKEMDGRYVGSVWIKIPMRNFSL